MLSRQSVQAALADGSLLLVLCARAMEAAAIPAKRDPPIVRAAHQTTVPSNPSRQPAALVPRCAPIRRTHRRLHTAEATDQPPVVARVLSGVLWNPEQALPASIVLDEAASTQAGGGIHEAGRHRGYGRVQHLVKRARHSMPPCRGHRGRRQHGRRRLCSVVAMTLCNTNRYGKYASAGRGKYEGRGKGSVSETRCCVATDTGSTRGNDNPGANICYLFAQGRCHLVRRPHYNSREAVARTVEGKQGACTCGKTTTRALSGIRVFVPALYPRRRVRRAAGHREGQLRTHAARD
jgi:hypothetical protein